MELNSSFEFFFFRANWMLFPVWKHWYSDVRGICLSSETHHALKGGQKPFAVFDIGKLVITDCCLEWNNTMTRCAFISSQCCESDLVFSISDSSEHVAIFFLQSMFAFSWQTGISHNQNLTPLFCDSYLLTLFAAVISCIIFAFDCFILIHSVAWKKLWKYTGNVQETGDWPLERKRNKGRDHSYILNQRFGTIC